MSEIEEEREFNVIENRAGYGKFNVKLKESELTSKHIDLFLGYLLQAWDNCPKETQVKFMQMLSDAVMDKKRESMYERFKDVLDMDDKK